MKKKKLVPGFFKRHLSKTYRAPLLAAVLMMQGFSFNANASLIGIVDSGTDVQHKDLAKFVWINPYEVANNLLDDDRNTLIDDLYGWNFADNNNDVIDYKFLGSFSPDVYRFFDIQAKMVGGDMTAQELMWIRERAQDDKFIQSVSTFANFMHGTHVSGISLGNSSQNKILSLKIIPTEVPAEAPDTGDGTQLPKKDPELSKWAIGKTLLMKKAYMKSVMLSVAEDQGKELVQVAKYLSDSGVDVANGSFGTSIEQISSVIKVIFYSLFDRLPTTLENTEYGLSFMKSILLEGQSSMLMAPQTLFVFAAGNDSSNNDISPVSPANIVARNVITVAATLGRKQLATFSNFGKTEVDVAAPGVNIKSTIPGDGHIRVSGTSQAAPYVTRVAAEMKRINPKLKPEELRKILMETVDYKSFLADKVASKGIVNDGRAIKAAELASDYGVTEAIQIAKSQVSDMAEAAEDDKALTILPEAFDYVLPLPSMLKWK